MDLRDVRMIEGRKELRFPAEPCEAIGIVGDGGQQDLDRDVAIQRRVAGAIDLAHPARADARRDLVHANALTLEALSRATVSSNSTAGVSRKLVARACDASNVSTSWRSASSPSHAAARYAGRASNASARAPSNTSFRRGQASGGGSRASSSNGLVHFAQDRGKPRIRVQRAVLRKVARPEDEGRLALIPRASGECHRLFMLPGSLSRDGQVRRRDITSRGDGPSARDAGRSPRPASPTARRLPPAR